MMTRPWIEGRFEDGVILTNDHVVARDRAEVTLADGRVVMDERAATEMTP